MDTRRLQRAVASTRGLVLAEALAALVIGLVADDVSLLKVPGYLVGVGAGIAILAFGGLVQGAGRARRLGTLSPDEVELALHRWRARGRLVAVTAALVFLVVLVLSSQGVPPWAL